MWRFLKSNFDRFSSVGQRQVNEPLPILSTVIHPVDLNASKQKYLLVYLKGR